MSSSTKVVKGFWRELFSVINQSVGECIILFISLFHIIDPQMFYKLRNNILTKKRPWVLYVSYNKYLSEFILRHLGDRNTLEVLAQIGKKNHRNHELLWTRLY